MTRDKRDRTYHTAGLISQLHNQTGILNRGRIVQGRSNWNAYDFQVILQLYFLVQTVN